MIPVAHIGGIPIEETVAIYGPTLLLAAGAAVARLGALRPGLLGRRRRARG